MTVDTYDTLGNDVRALIKKEEYDILVRNTANNVIFAKKLIHEFKNIDLFLFNGTTNRHSGEIIVGRLLTLIDELSYVNVDEIRALVDQLDKLLKPFRPNDDR